MNFPANRIHDFSNLNDVELNNSASLGAYQLSDLEVSFYHEQGRSTAEEFEQWVLQLNTEEDNVKSGTDTITRLHVNNKLRFEPDCTVIFKERETHQIVATATHIYQDGAFAPRHRYFYEPGFLGMWDFFQVKRELRGFGLGTIISQYMDKRVQDFVDQGRQDRLVCLYTGDMAAVRIYSRLGFTPSGRLNAHAGILTGDTLFTKTFKPRNSRSRREQF